MDIRGIVAVPNHSFAGVNDNINPIQKSQRHCDVADNWELSEDYALTMRKGSMLFDRATRLRMAARASFLTEAVSGAGLEIGTYHYVARYFDPVGVVYTIPFPTRTAVTTSGNQSVFVQIWAKNNPDNTLYTQLQILRTVVDADIFTGKYYVVTTGFDEEVAADDVIRYSDTTTDAALVGNPFIHLDDTASTGLGLDHPVTAIIDFRRRQGGSDIIYTAGKYIKSAERIGSIYEALTADRLNSWSVFQNAVWLVNGKDFLGINSARTVFTMGGTGPVRKPDLLHITGPLSGPYRYVFTWYDNGTEGTVTEHPWESRTSPISNEINLTSGGVLVTRQPVAVDPPPARATHWKLYRTDSAGSIELAKLVDTIPIADFEFFDKTPDTSLIPEFAPFDYNDPPSDLKLTWILEMGERLYGGGDYNHPTTLYWSRKGFPEQWSVLHNRFPLDEEDGDPLTGGAVLDGVLYVFKEDYVYRMIGDPPVDADRFGLKEGCANWRSVVATKNGIFWQGADSVFWTNGNQAQDAGTFIARFFENQIDPTMSTLRSSQIVDYRNPTKRQLVCSFRTGASGSQNNVAGIHHYRIGNQAEGWTFFKNWLVSTMGIVKTVRRRDMLLLGTDDGDVYNHDITPGYDRRIDNNRGGANAPFLESGVINSLIIDDDLLVASWTTTGTGTFENVPASHFHIANTGPGDVLITAKHDTFDMDAYEACRITLTDFKITTISTSDVPFVDGIIFFIYLAANPGYENYQLGQYSRMFTTIGINSEGLFIRTIAAGVTSELLVAPFATWFTAGVEYDMIFEFTPSLHHDGDSGWHTKHLRWLIDDVVVYSGPIGGTPFLDSGTSGKFTISLGKDDAGTPLNDMVFDQLLAEEFDHRTSAIQTTESQTPIVATYESPWFNFGAQHAQKFIKWLEFVARSNFDGGVEVTLFTELVLADGQTETVELKGGSLFDKAIFDKDPFDGLQRVIGERMGFDVTGKNIKVRLVVNEPGAFVELFGYDMGIGGLEPNMWTANARSGRDGSESSDSDSG